MHQQPIRRSLALLALAGLCLLLAGCLLTPGRFTSSLDIRRDGTFAFAYTGEIHMLALSKLAEAGKDARLPNAAPFQPACFQQDGVKPRPCSSAEIAEQRRHHDEDASASGAKKQRDAEMAKQLLGGLDPTNPKSAEEFAARLRKQAGWRRVDYKGDGLFVVDFAIAGRLDHDLVFPVIEHFPAANAFVTVYRHGDGSLRVEAPAYAGSANGGSFMALMQAGMMAKAADAKPGEAPAPMSLIDGRFTLTTDAAILANNTEEGPKPDARGQRLEWVVNSQTLAVPSALLQLRAP